MAWPKEQYGKFFSGDAYIVLKASHRCLNGFERCCMLTRVHVRAQTTAPQNSNALLYDIFFWLGKDCSQDEQGVAAYKTVELVRPSVGAVATRSSHTHRCLNCVCV